MAASWTGAIELAGFPVNVAFHNRVKSRSGESFKTLAPNGRPIKQYYRDDEGNEVDRVECSKGVEIVKGEYVALSDEALGVIEALGRTQVAEPETFMPLGEVPLDLAVASYAVVADKKVPGASKSVNVIWNGLRATQLAYITRITMRSGSRDSIVALYANEQGLYAVALPFTSELNEVPQEEFEVNAEAEALFVGVTADQVGKKDLGALESGWKARRQEVVEAALSNQPFEIKAPEQAPEVPDLMAALKAKMAVVA